MMQGWIWGRCLIPMDTEGQGKLWRTITTRHMESRLDLVMSLVALWYVEVDLVMSLAAMWYSLMM